MSLYHCVTFFPLVAIYFVFNNLKSNLLTALTRQNITKEPYCTRKTKHRCISAQCIFNCNTSVTVHKHRTVFFQLKPLPRSTKNLAVIICVSAANATQRVLLTLKLCGLLNNISCRCFKWFYTRHLQTYKSEDFNFEPYRCEKLKFRPKSVLHCLKIPEHLTKVCDPCPYIILVFIEGTF